MTGKRAAGRQAIVNAPEIVADETVADPRFSMEPGGLYRKTESGPWLICGRFEILSETRDDDAQAWGLWLRFRDRDGAEQTLVVPRELFAGEGAELRTLLARRGLYINPARGAGAALCEYLSKVSTPKRARIVSRTGWHRLEGGRVFILPDEVFGRPSIEVVYAPMIREPSLFNAGGTLEQWRTEVAARCAGNTRLVLAVSAAFAAPLLDLLDVEGGGLHLRGASRVGKTTALRVGASVWGGEPGGGAGAYIRQWRVTSNAVEGVATAHSDTLLALDELGQADARDVGGVAYMLANGQGKSRMDRGATLRAPMRFRTLFLSTGELGLADKIAEAGGTVKAGQEVRLVDIAADAGAGLGILEQLHGSSSAAVFTHELKDATARLYGTAAPAFLRWLLGKLSEDAEYVDELKDWHKNLTNTWLRAYPEAGGQVASVGRRFALIAVAGEIATQAGITGWQADEATGAALACFLAWLNERGTVGAREDAQAIAQMRAFIGSASSRFEDWRDPLPGSEAVQGDPESSPPPERFRVVNRAGWRRWLKDGEQPYGWMYYVLPAAMREALAGLDFKAALKVLGERGFLIAGSNGKSAQSLTPPGHPKARLYAVRPSILGADEGGD